LSSCMQDHLATWEENILEKDHTHKNILEHLV